MAKKRGRLRLVSAQDPASVFDDLDALRRAQAVPARPAFRGQHRQRIEETFARIPFNRARVLYRHIGGPAWMLLIELDRLVFEGRGKNPVRLTSAARRASGMTKWTLYRSLRLLEAAGIVTVKRKRGRCPLVTFLWHPIQP
jgi:hypothetical protein